MAKKSWLKIIGALKRIVRDNGSIWPAPSTKLAGYAEDGPYHCGDCVYLKRVNGKPVKDENGKGFCNQAVMLADPDIKKSNSGLALVNIEKGCCEFVEPPKKGE